MAAIVTLITIVSVTTARHILTYALLPPTPQPTITTTIVPLMT